MKFQKFLKVAALVLSVVCPIVGVVSYCFTIAAKKKEIAMYVKQENELINCYQQMGITMGASLANRAEAIRRENERIAIEKNKGKSL